MKKLTKNQTIGFTLIELLAVIIILAIISLIATPIILNVIEDVKNSADMSSALLIANGGHDYYAGAMLDENKKDKIKNGIDIYPELNIINKPEIGELYVNEKNEIAMAVIINNKCYKKTYTGEIEIVENVDCDLGYMGPDDIKPDVKQKVINASSNEHGWYKEDIYVEIEVIDKESGPMGYKRCMGNSECEPSEDIYKLDEEISINTESENNFVCVIGIDNKGNKSGKSCINYKIDKTQPTIEGIEDKTIQKGENVDLSSGVTYSDALSQIDGSLLIEPSSIDTSTIGVKEVKYSIKDKAGNTSTRNYTIKIDKTAPSVASLSVANHSTNSITVTASGSDSTSGIYSYTFQKSTISSTTGFTTVETKTTTATSYSYSYSNLSDGTTYYLRVIVTDKAGNTKTSTVITQKTDTAELAWNDLKIGDYIDYTLTNGSFSSRSTYNDYGNLNFSAVTSLNWRVLAVNSSTLTLISDTTVNIDFYL